MFQWLFPQTKLLSVTYQRDVQLWFYQHPCEPYDSADQCQDLITVPL